MDAEGAFQVLWTLDGLQSFVSRAVARNFRKPLDETKQLSSYKEDALKLSACVWRGADCRRIMRLDG